uniref:(northern house mosquito) hypothetical protein n=1 Tax=Culex pipiens TaxID=7175 RepID=A0A8D8BLK7_CULPI
MYITIRLNEKERKKKKKNQHGVFRPLSLFLLLTSFSPSLSHSLCKQHDISPRGTRSHLKTNNQLKHATYYSSSSIRLTVDHFLRTHLYYCSVDKLVLRSL